MKKYLIIFTSILIIGLGFATNSCSEKVAFSTKVKNDYNLKENELKELQFQDVTSEVTVCRDPKDNKFLSLALDSNADFLVTGDKDLLEVGKFFKTEIITPRDFLEKFN